jgi:hypothetical protein
MSARPTDSKTMATTTHLVRISEVGDCVQQVIDDLNAKFWAMNQRGHFVEMPEELAFEMVVLKEFEAFTSTDTEISDGTEKQSGFTVEQSKSSGSDSQNSTDTKSSRTTNIHNNSGSSTDTFKEA